ncbi:MAG TPA: class I SAM-dependent methyltransferase [Acidobacteriaceae bacterium]|jgi:SAM-dependent methyltransferase|nr:class I SAM-dependent methyltransferase [Acidobacteriaceae bacterium]
MRWLLKSMAQNVFAVLPAGHRINHLFQGNTNARLIPGHLEQLKRLQPILTGKMKTAVEIGTGWCPTIPLGLTVRGITVHSYDHLRHVTPAAISASQHATGGDWSKVHYHAPGDGTATGLPDDSVDLHFSIAVFEHIPREIIIGLLAEAYRILKPGATLYHEIDLRDHFAEFDRSITTVNFLKFSDRTWKVIGQNKIQYHNRLRASDFRTLFCDAGFEIVSLEARTDERAASALTQMHLSPRFGGYERSDLAVSVIDVIAQKPNS